MPDAARRPGFSLEDAVLDIGGDVGALILYTDAAYAGREIELSRLGGNEASEPGHEQPAGHGHDDADHGHGPGEHGHDHEHEHRVHTAILERRAGGTVTWAGIYPELAAGRYRVWIEDPELPNEVTIVGGEVAELDWRS
jgi:hypothetical protein